MTPGAYTYTATGVNGAIETILTVNIGNVLEPSSLTMSATALGLLGGLAFHRRRRNKV
jgi:MYXO-CTERM domain-containing protein